MSKKTQKGGFVRGAVKAFKNSADWVAENTGPKDVYAHGHKPATPGRCGGCGRRIPQGDSHCHRPACFKYFITG